MTIGSDVAMTESKTAKRLSTYLAEEKFNGFWLRSASNKCCHARSTKYFQVRWNNDCWGWPPFDGPDVVGWFSASACERRLYRVSCCWQVYWNWEISWVTVFPCYDQCLNCIMQEVGLAEQSWKNPTKSSFKNSKWTSSGISRNAERIVFQICGKLCCPSCWAKLLGAWSLNRVTQLLTMWTDSSENI